MPKSNLRAQIRKLQNVIAQMASERDALIDENARMRQAGLALARDVETLMSETVRLVPVDEGMDGAAGLEYRRIDIASNHRLIVMTGEVSDDAAETLAHALREKGIDCTLIVVPEEDRKSVV